jgi:hypothetical protein
MRRFLCSFLTALGLGMIVGGISFTPPERPDPLHVLEQALRGGDQQATMQQLTDLVRFASERPHDPPDGRRREEEMTISAIASALKGFGTAFFVFGLLGLTIPLLHRSLKQAAESKPTGPPGI